MSGRSAREGALSGRAVRAGSRLARAALPLVLLAMWSTAAQADGLSLFPARDPAALLSAFDGAGSSEPRLALAQWRPYGLSGVDVLVATGSLGLGPLRVSAAYEEQDWGVLRGRCVRLGLHAAAGAVRAVLTGPPPSDVHAAVGVVSTGVPCPPHGPPAARPSAASSSGVGDVDHLHRAQRDWCADEGGGLG